MRPASRIVLGVALLLGCTPPDHKVDDLITQLSAAPAGLRVNAAYELGRLRPGYVESSYVPRGAGPLPLAAGEQRIVEALDHVIGHGRDERSRQEAVRSLTILRPPGRQAGVERCVVEEANGLGLTCLEALEKFYTPALIMGMVELFRGWTDDNERNWWDWARNWLEMPGATEAVDHLIARDDDPELLARTLKMFRADYRAEIGVRLARASKSKHAPVRLRALRLLDLNAFKVHREDIRRLLDDPDPQIRNVAAEILAKQAWSEPAPTD